MSENPTRSICIHVWFPGKTRSDQPPVEVCVACGEVRPVGGAPNARERSLDDIRRRRDILATTRPFGDFTADVVSDYDELLRDARADAQPRLVAALEKVAGYVPFLLSVIASGEDLEKREERDIRDALAALATPGVAAVAEMHRYSPDSAQYGGDCRVCGHVADDPLHAVPPPAAPEAKP